jgi:hypothetical protein
MLKERWLDMAEDEKSGWRECAEWDKKRYAHELAIFEKGSSRKAPKDSSSDDEMEESNAAQTVHVPKKRKLSVASPVPKKTK